jgi:uncharacterized DUF497 family protein
MTLEFEWDAAKAVENLKNHGREIIIGHSEKRRLVLVSFTERVASGEDYQRAPRYEARALRL